MLKTLRWRITLMFVGLSAVIYVSLTLLGLVIFERGLTASLDKELREIASEIGHAIEIENGNPKFRDWIRTVQTQPPRSLATIQLFDRAGRLLEHYGPPGTDQLFHATGHAIQAPPSIRVLCGPLVKDKVVCGFLQIQLSTRDRDLALKQLKWQAFASGIAFLLALSLVGYWIARRASQQVEDSVQILRSFVADASHELNTPITILQARTESLERKLSKLGIQEEDLTATSKAVERLNHVVNDLLLLSEVEDPISGMSKTRVDVASLIDELVEEDRDRFKSKSVELNLHKTAEAFVNGNAGALRRMLANLLENALRYTNAGGKVDIFLESSDKEVRLAVRDTGIGIPADSLSRIFDRFFRVDKSRSRASGGTGLGLAIVKAIIDAHRGTISVESQVGTGSTFTVRFPRLRRS